MNNGFKEVETAVEEYKRSNNSQALGLAAKQILDSVKTNKLLASDNNSQVVRILHSLDGSNLSFHANDLLKSIDSVEVHKSHEVVSLARLVSITAGFVSLSHLMKLSSALDSKLTLLVESNMDQLKVE